MLAQGGARVADLFAAVVPPYGTFPLLRDHDHGPHQGPLRETLMEIRTADEAGHSAQPSAGWVGESALRGSRLARAISLTALPQLRESDS